MNCPRKITKRSYASGVAQKGQALVVILLVSVIGLTIGLTLASRSTEETSITTELEESSRAFSAAEAGLEESVETIGIIPTGPYTGSVGNAQYRVDVEQAGGTDDAFRFPGKIKNNQPITVWLAGHDSTTGLIDTGVQYGKDEIDICWGEDGGDEAALEMTLYYKKATYIPIPTPTPPGSGTRYATARATYKPPGLTLIGGAHDSTVQVAGSSDSFCDSNFKYKINVDFALVDIDGSDLISEYPFDRSAGDELLYMKIRPIINDTNGDSVFETVIGVDPVDTDLPTQGEIHTSTGTTSGGRQTKIVQFISHPAPPELFDAVIYSDKSLTK